MAICIMKKFETFLCKVPRAPNPVLPPPKKENRRAAIARRFATKRKPQCTDRRTANTNSRRLYIYTSQYHVTIKQMLMTNAC